jgi:hypothetical protein
MGNSRSIRSSALHVTADIKFTSLAALICLYSLLVIFAQVLVVMPCILVLLNKRNLVRASIRVLKFKVVNFSLIVL